MSRAYGNNASSYWRTYLDYTTSSTSTSYTISCSAFGVYWSQSHNHTLDYDRPSKLSCTGYSDATYTPTGDVTKSAGGTYNFKSQSTTFSFTRTTSSKTVTLKGAITHSSGGNEYSGTSTAYATITVPALPQYKISFDKNTTATVTNMPSAIYAYHGVLKTLNVNVPNRTGYKFTGWKRFSNNLIYVNGEQFSTTAAFTFYAQWKAIDPPTCYYTSLSKSKTMGGNAIKGFTNISTTISGLKAKHGRSISSVTLKIGSATATRTTNGTLTISGANLATGTYTPTLTLTDSAGASTTYSYSKLKVVAPIWRSTVTVTPSPLGENPPQVTKSGYGIFEYIKVYNYKNLKWDIISSKTMPVTIGNNNWTFTYDFDEDHSKQSTTDPQQRYFGTISFAYRHYEIDEMPARKAFFTTSRNQNFSNGIYNVMFVGGVDNATNPNYSSRVWWSAINNPLYFPELNYAEVGSNDTAIQGLTKVGDYLAVVKQSKTIDTAIFLLYPTSFEENTTYAVKQGVQGVGALSKYSFNILGDETLFLSPNGVMAIVPSQDEEHKVQNRSYFVDGKMLKEENIANAYSFVIDGKYYLSVGNGSVYVLDGNQRNSWGNDRTNLVYECYYLENIPAKCFVKYHDSLVFSDSENVCMFTKGSYTDAYNMDGATDVPVKAEWSTILDDDGALHYYKTMQKKGNLVSILPTDYKFCEVEVTEEEFDSDKDKYFTYTNGIYQPCNEETVYDANETYYVRGSSATRVFIRKDNNDLVEIERKFGTSTLIPSEMMLNKKCKKYKRLQFILTNDEAEAFGVDEIIKCYTIGGYAKR